MNACVFESGSKPLSSPGGQTIERLDKYRTLIVDDRLLECNYAARSKISKSAPYRVEWICRIHENESSNNCVHSRGEFDFPEIARHKANVCEALRLGALRGELDLGGVAVNTGDITRWPHQLGGQQRDIARP